MKKILFALSLILLGCCATAETQPDAIYRLLSRHYTINQDGTMDVRFRKEITILRNRALTAYADKGETFIVYNPDIEELTINESYTQTPDGRKVTTPQNAFVKQLPSECADCGRYNHIAEMAVIHTGMEYGCTIVLDYTIHRKEVLRGDVFTLQTDCPVERYEVVYDHGGRVLDFTLPSEGTLVQDGHDFHWVATNIPQSSGESYLSKVDPYRMSVKFRTFVKPEVAQGIPEADDVLGEVYQSDTLGYIMAIRNWVNQNIHLNAITPAQTNYEAAPAAVTFASNCGSRLDKAVLLVAMLRQAGFTADLDDEMFLSNIYDDTKLKVAFQYQGMTMLLGPDGNHQPMVKGGAREMDRMQSQVSVQTVTPQRIGGRYYSHRFTVPTFAGIDVTQLTSSRTQQLRVIPTKSKVEQTLTLDGSYTILNPLKLKYGSKKVGNIEIVVEQTSPNTIHIMQRCEVTQPLIAVKDYEMFRQMMVDWQSHNELMLEKK